MLDAKTMMEAEQQPPAPPAPPAPLANLPIEVEIVSQQAQGRPMITGFAAEMEDDGEDFSTPPSPPVAAGATGEPEPELGLGDNHPLDGLDDLLDDLDDSHEELELEPSQWDPELLTKPLPEPLPEASPELEPEPPTTGEPEPGLDELIDPGEKLQLEPSPTCGASSTEDWLQITDWDEVEEPLPGPLPDALPEPPTDKDASQAGEEAKDAENFAAPPPPPAALTPPPPPPSKPKTRQGKALFAWNAAGGAAEDDLLFETATIIDLVNDEPGDGWSTGRLAGVEGVYPTAYVQELEPEQEVELPPAPPPLVVQPQPEVTVSPEEVVDTTPPELVDVSLVTVELTQLGTLGISLEEIKGSDPYARILTLREGTQAKEHSALLVPGLRLVSIHGMTCVGVEYRDVVKMLQSPELGQQRPLKLQWAVGDMLSEEALAARIEVIWEMKTPENMQVLSRMMAKNESKIPAFYANLMRKHEIDETFFNPPAAAVEEVLGLEAVSPIPATREARVRAAAGITKPPRVDVTHHPTVAHTGGFLVDSPQGAASPLPSANLVFGTGHQAEISSAAVKDSIQEMAALLVQAGAAFQEGMSESTRQELNWLSEYLNKRLPEQQY